MIIMALNIDHLNEYLNGSFADRGHPQWFKLWADKYADALDIENLDNCFTAEEKELFFADVGVAFINSLFYFRDINTEDFSEYKLRTRDGRVLWNALKRDIDQSYRDYIKRVQNGTKGGRPRKDLNNQ